MRFLSESGVPQVRALGAHPKNCRIFFFENKIGTHGTQILREKFGFGQIAQKMPIPCLSFQLIFHIQNHHFSALILRRFSNVYSSSLEGGHLGNFNALAKSQ